MLKSTKKSAGQAIRSAIIMCAISWSGAGLPSLYTHDIRFQIMSSSVFFAPVFLRS